MKAIAPMVTIIPTSAIISRFIFDTPFEGVNSLSTLGKHHNVPTKVCFWLSKETWIKPHYDRIIIFVKRDNDSLCAIAGKAVLKGVAIGESYQITDLH
jgi:hypothetical protein